tara:strand:+ start:368 stop:1252 length:885 start_codon:yes stop_codon:yes gene_type:complete
MSELKINNPVYEDLIKLNLIDPKEIRVFHNKTRDGDFKVLIDKSSDLLFLEKNSLPENYYQESPEAAGFDNFFKKNGYFEDDLRRFNFLKKYIKNNNYLLDVGSEWGGFLKLSKDYCKKVEGAELNQIALEYVEKNLKIKVHKDLKLVNDKPDLLTMFHVLEHIPYQLNFLNLAYEKLKSGGNIVIEVPHANDYLLKKINLPEVKDFLFWNEHLVLHTKNSLKAFVDSAGFIEAKIFHIQRYGFLNHFGWLHDRKPGGHEKYLDNFNKDLNDSYCRWLIETENTDTLICVAKKK